MLDVNNFDQLRIGLATATDYRSRPDRKDGRQPTSFLEDHLEVVVVAQVGSIIMPPAELQCLTLCTFARHALGLFDDFKGKLVADCIAIVE